MYERSVVLKLTGMDLIEIEDHIIAHQGRMIRERFGQEADHKANYGWGVNEEEQFLSVETKVYVKPPWVLTTTVRLDMAVEAEFEDAWSRY
jgi:hypothetical protein